jgi:hypothetical protein
MLGPHHDEVHWEPHQGMRAPDVGAPHWGTTGGFLAGELRWDPLCDGEVTHDEAAAIRQRAGNGVQPQSSPMLPTASAGRGGGDE